MSQYSEVVEEQRLLIAAEKWAIEVRSIHGHSTDTMHYDDRPEDTKNGGVIDVEYNGGWIDRYQNGVLIHTFGKKFSRSELIDRYERANG